MRTVCLLICMPFLMLGCGGPAPSGSQPAPVVAVFEEGAPLDALLGTVARLPFVALSGGASPRWVGDADANWVEHLRAGGSARFVEPLVEFEASRVPSDPSFHRQWALEAVDAPKGWDLAPSANGGVVAVVDSGVQLDHPDLGQSLWLNEGETPDNGVDDDENGFVDDVHGWDFVDDDADPAPAAGAAASFHGTHVAGIIAAGWNNGRGTAGIAPGARVMCLRALAGRRGSSERVADAIDYAVANGARVINLSLGGGYSQLVDEALARAEQAGVLVVAAAGNDGASSPTFPASSDRDNVIGVAATDRNGNLAHFSNRGPGVDVEAPGVEILGPYGKRGYSALSGTSMAAPHVSGAIALALRGRERLAAGRLLSRLPLGPDGTPRLVLPSLVAGDAPLAGELSLRRSHLRFRVAGLKHRPPPQTLAVDAPVPTPFDVEAPAWVRPGSCRRAPCRLSVSILPSMLHSGSNRGRLVLHPEGGQPVAVALEVLLGEQPPVPLSIEATVDGTFVEALDTLELPAGSVVRLRLLREGHPAQGRWSLDGTALEGGTMQGTFVRSGRYKVTVADPGAGEVSLELVVVGVGGAGAAPGLGVP